MCAHVGEGPPSPGHGGPVLVHHGVGGVPDSAETVPFGLVLVKQLEIVEHHLGAILEDDLRVAILLREGGRKRYREGGGGKRYREGGGGKRYREGGGGKRYREGGGGKRYREGGGDTEKGEGGRDTESVLISTCSVECGLILCM